MQNVISKKDIFKETLVLVLSGLVINFPLNIVILYVLIDVMAIQSTLVLSVVATAVFTVVAIARTYFIRYRTELKKITKRNKL